MPLVALRICRWKAGVLAADVARGKTNACLNKCLFERIQIHLLNFTSHITPSSSGSEPHANRIAKCQVVIKRSDNICLFGSATLACPLGAMLSLLRWQALAAVSWLQLFRVCRHDQNLQSVVAIPNAIGRYSLHRRTYKLLVGQAGLNLIV